MKKIIVLLLATITFLCFSSCDSGGGGDDLPSIYDAPYSSRKALAVSNQALLDIVYEYETNGTYPNVSESENTLTFSNAEKTDVTYDYSHYQVNLTGSLTMENANSMVYDFSIVRCKSYSETLYCSFYIVQEKKNGVNKIKKLILNGTEYKPE